MSHSPVPSLVPSQEASPDSETKKDSQSPVAVPSLASSLEEVENRALSCVASLHLPLLPPCLTRQEIIFLLQNYRKVCKELKEQMAMLLLLTDLISNSITQPCLQVLQRLWHHHQDAVRHPASAIHQDAVKRLVLRTPRSMDSKPSRFRMAPIVPKTI